MKIMDEQKKSFLKKADELTPVIYKKEVYFNDCELVMNTGKETVFDLGNHYAGFFEFEIARHKVYLDAPVKLSIKFCETERELEDDFSKYCGVLCPSWLQEEIFTADYAGKYKLDRRYAARYVKITVLSTPQEFVLKNVSFASVTSADENSLVKHKICDELLKKIDEISVNTLKNCMQRVFEDGPKLDRRLWLGDLRLEALANHVTFANESLTERCLYLFAASEKNSHGFIQTHVYDYPEFYSGDWVAVDYSLLFCVTLCDMYEHTANKELFLELYETAKSQIDACEALLDEDGILSFNNVNGAFIDWRPGLEKKTSLHGVYMYTLCKMIDVLEKIGSQDAAYFIEKYDCAKRASQCLFDKEKGMYKGGKDSGQYSVHSVVWMILGGAVIGTEAEKMLCSVLDDKDTVKPFTPYMHHYVVEAFIKLGMIDKAKEYIINYWGEMVKRGADTFYEVFVPENVEFSPYNDRMINSACHAWSCTPSYFIRKYLI